MDGMLQRFPRPAVPQGARPGRQWDKPATAEETEKAIAVCLHGYLSSQGIKSCRSS